MPENGGSYTYIQISAADNGWYVSYDIKTKNPMEAESTFGSSQYSYKEKKELFEIKTGVNAEQALDAALALVKKLYLSNKVNEEVD